MARFFRIVFAAAFAAVATVAATLVAAQPQKIYRCGPDGRQLQQYPCGTAAPAATTPAPSEADRAAAAAVARATPNSPSACAPIARSANAPKRQPTAL